VSRLVTDWRAWLAPLLVPGIQFTRQDLALDDRSGLLPLEEIRRLVEADLWVSRLKYADDLKRRRHGRGVCGETISFGAPSTDTQVRFYE
jgi:hypothetical protein